MKHLLLISALLIGMISCTQNNNHHQDFNPRELVGAEIMTSGTLGVSIENNLVAQKGDSIFFLYLRPVHNPNNVYIGYYDVYCRSTIENIKRITNDSIYFGEWVEHIESFNERRVK